MGDRSSDLSRFVEGRDINTFGLQLIGTPDTRKLVEATAEQIQLILNAGRTKGSITARDEEVSTQIFDDYSHFTSGESISTLEESVRGRHCYLFSDPNGDYKKSDYPLNDKFLSDLLLLQSIKDNGARTTNAVIPCMPYARQDKTTPNRRQSASIDSIGKWLSDITGETGYVIDMQLHNPASKSAFSGTQFIDLYSGWMIEEVIRDLGLNRPNLVLSPADQGGMKSVEAISKELEIANIIVIKSRNYAKQNTVDSIDVFGDIEGKDVIIFDDMLDTGGTMAKLLEEMLVKKPKSINVVVSHGMFNGKAYEKLAEVIEKSNGVIQNIYSSNSINKEDTPDFIKTISMKNILANTITGIYKGFSVNRGDSTDYAKTI